MRRWKRWVERGRKERKGWSSHGGSGLGPVLGGLDGAAAVSSSDEPADQRHGGTELDVTSLLNPDRFSKETKKRTLWYSG